MLVTCAIVKYALQRIAVCNECNVVFNVYPAAIESLPMQHAMCAAVAYIASQQYMCIHAS